VVLDNTNKASIKYPLSNRIYINIAIDKDKRCPIGAFLPTRQNLVDIADITDIADIIDIVIL